MCNRRLQQQCKAYAQLDGKLYRKRFLMADAPIGCRSCLDWQFRPADCYPVVKTYMYVGIGKKWIVEAKTDKKGRDMP